MHSLTSTLQVGPFQLAVQLQVNPPSTFVQPPELLHGAPLHSLTSVLQSSPCQPVPHSDGINAFAVATVLPGTIVYVGFAVVAVPASLTIAAVAVQGIDTCSVAAVDAVGGALVDVSVARLSAPAVVAAAREIVVAVFAAAVRRAILVFAFVDVCFAESAVKAVVAGARKPSCVERVLAFAVA